AACELIAVYNVLKWAGRPSPLSVIAQRFIERGGIWRRGHWGTRYWKMPRVLRELGGVRVIRVLFPQFRRSRLEKLRGDNSLILSVVNPGGIRKGIHTFAAFREENGIRFYNSYNRTGTSWLQYPTVRELLSSLRIPFILGAYFVEK
ncbi:MAG: hypothetical protein MJ067_06720, partial [Oscillospiraceae bacterium]|nr:hypothetical protein [Oscillospiraceae bacterium]